MALKGLVDRQPELERLLALVDAATAGRGCLMLVEGPAGIGKTRLLAAGSELAADRGLRALVARGSELERDYPFGAVRQLLEPYLNELDEPERAAAFAGSAAHALPLLAHTDGQSGDADYATLYGLYWLLVALSQREPLLLCVDDIHWLDTPSLRFLGFLARRIDGMRLLLCGALRPAEEGTDRALVSDLSLAPGVETVRPAPLTVDGASALIAAELGTPPEPAFVAECVSTTGGNPFYLSDLIREAAAQALAPTAAEAGRVRELRRAGRIFEPLGFRNPSAHPWRSALAVASGDAALARAELADARRNGFPRGLGVALRRAAGVTGDVHLLHEAVEVLEGSHARLEHARALVELGAAQRRAGDRTAAREPLRAGLDIAQRCGAIRLADRARDELRATGARPRREAISGRDALTASELRIAQMAASGLSNPEIAQALFVTIKTVEGHLSGAYRKLEVRSRAEFPRALDS